MQSHFVLYQQVSHSILSGVTWDFFAAHDITGEMSFCNWVVMMAWNVYLIPILLMMVNDYRSY